jgi:hypothetical protein
MLRFRLVFGRLTVFPLSEIVTAIPLGPKNRQTTKSLTDLTHHPV